MANNKLTLKQLRIAAQEAIEKKVANKNDLMAALPILVELQEAAANEAKIVKECRTVAGELSEACAKYGLKCPGVFDEGLSLSPIGVRSGNVTFNDVTYHFASGYDKPKRISGETMTQDFLSALPESWTKGKLELDVTGINRMNITEEALEKAGLYRPEKNEWKR